MWYPWADCTLSLPICTHPSLLSFELGALRSTEEVSSAITKKDRKQRRMAAHATPTTHSSVHTLTEPGLNLPSGLKNR